MAVQRGETSKLSSIRFDRPLAAPGEAVVDFLGLLGHMDMDRGHRVDPCQDLVQELGRDSPQRVRREAEAAQRMAGDCAAQGFLDLQVAIGIIDEAALPGDRRLPAEAAVDCRASAAG